MSSHAPASVSGLVHEQVTRSLTTQDLPVATKEFGQNHETMQVLLRDQAQVISVYPNEDTVHSRFAQEDSGHVPARYANHMVLEIPYFQSGPSTRKDDIRSTPHFNYMRTDGSTSETIEGEAWIPEGIEFCEGSLISCTVFGSRSCNPADVLHCLIRDGYVSAKFDSSLNGTRLSRHFDISNVRGITIPTPTVLPRRTSRVSQAQNPEIREISRSRASSTYQPTNVHTQSSSRNDFKFEREPTSRSRVSNTSSIGSFVSARSQMSFIGPRSSHGNSAFFSARGSGSATLIRTIREDETPSSDLSAPLARLHSDYYITLHQQNIIQPFDKELNWSRKGQHVTFTTKDEVPLLFLSHLGSSNTATVDKVFCRRIALARKTMRCNMRWTVADASREVYHLQNLRHFHIVQLVGTYLQGRNFSILMYPVADSHLGAFLEETCDMPASEEMNAWSRRRFLATTFGCLAAAMAFIHEKTTKHMDIKPQNILVRCLKSSIPENWRVYIADFGLSRSFGSQDHSQTDGPTSRTPRYCSPEVYNDEPRGRPSDVFSLGCVFLEIFCVLEGKELQDFTDARRASGDDESFHGNLERVIEWAGNSLNHQTLPSIFDSSGDFVAFKLVVEMVIRMIRREPDLRPTAAQIRERIVNLYESSFAPCLSCSSPPEPYERFGPPSDEETNAKRILGAGPTAKDEILNTIARDVDGQGVVI